MRIIGYLICGILLWQKFSERPLTKNLERFPNGIQCFFRISGCRLSRQP